MWSRILFAMAAMLTVTVLIQVGASPVPDQCATTQENGMTVTRCSDGHGGTSESRRKLFFLSSLYSACNYLQLFRHQLFFWTYRGRLQQWFPAVFQFFRFFRAWRRWRGVPNPPHINWQIRIYSILRLIQIYYC